MHKVFHYILVFSVWIGCVTPLTTFADRVEGIVTPPVSSFVVLNEKGEIIKTVSVNQEGKFTVYLKPGLYQVRSSRGEAILRSEAKPMRNQRITFE